MVEQLVGAAQHAGDVGAQRDHIGPDGLGVQHLVERGRPQDLRGRQAHQAGDLLLQSAAAVWRTQLRAGDTIARYGGEEFAVLLPACSIRKATQVLERLRASTPTVTCAAGLAGHEPGETAEELTSRADRALYQAKDVGRDRLVAA